MPDHAGQTVYSDLRSPIDAVMVGDAIDFIEAIVHVMYDVASFSEPSSPAK